MLATQIRQKDSVFYFVGYSVEDLLARVRFISRFYSDGDPSVKGDRGDRGNQIRPDDVPATDEVGQFIAKIERTDTAFQRDVSKAKVGAIQNYYETAVSQPPIPGTVLLFTSEKLRFEPIRGFDNIGHLEEPRGKYLIIDGQHRLAALHFYRNAHPDDAATIHVPCVIFDGKSEDFATEMFVTINSTPTRINKSHLIDLYERVSWTGADRKLAARVVQKLYEEHDSPLRYRINRLGGRSKQEKWILQAELFNEVHRWTRDASGKPTAREAERLYDIVRDFLKAAARVWGDAWGHASSPRASASRSSRENYMVTRPVVLKAMLRVCGDLAALDGDPADGRVARWEARLAAWGTEVRTFRTEGFYERFPAKGQIERVARIHRELGRIANIPARKNAKGED